MWLQITPDNLEHKSRKLDCQYWLRSLDKHGIVKKKLPRRADKITGADLFQALYQWEPSLRDSPLDPALHKWLEDKMGSPEMLDLRRETMGDEPGSAYAAVKLFQELMRPRESTFKTIQTTRHNALIGQGLAQDEADRKTIKETFQEIQETLAEGMSSGELPLDEKDFSKAVKTVKEDLEAVGDFTDILGGSSVGGGFGLGGSDERIIEMGLDEQLMRTLKGQAEFRRIMALLGRLRLMAQAIKAKKPKKMPRPVGVATGRELSDLLPQEVALLGDEDLELLFYQRFLNGELYQYEHKRIEKEGKGPIVGLLDVSGSMEGFRTEMSKAFFLLMVRTAVEQNRKIVYVPFASQAGDPLYIEDYPNLIQVISPGRFHLGYGTDFDQALNRAMEVIDRSGSYRNADVILLTDGDSRLSIGDRVREWKSETGARLMGALFTGRWKQDMKSLLDVGVEVNGSGEISWTEELIEQLV